MIMTSGLTCSFATSSARAVMISASARPLAAFKVLTVVRQEVTSLVLSKVCNMSWMASGGGAAMQL